jgi:hypothetical protein
MEASEEEEAPRTENVVELRDGVDMLVGTWTQAMLAGEVLRAVGSEILSFQGAGARGGAGL